MTVFENVAFGLKVKKLSPEVIQEKVFEMLSLVDMTEQADKNVQFLSGGQRQRVALARSLVTEPKVLLLDEPLSALDARIRKQLQRDLRAIQQSLGMTMIFVTHDQEEAMRISDRIFCDGSWAGGSGFHLEGIVSESSEPICCGIYRQL